MIYSAKLKDSYYNFILEILECFKPEYVVTREEYYFSFLKLDYNICPKNRAGSWLDYKHCEKLVLR